MNRAALIQLVNHKPSAQWVWLFTALSTALIFTLLESFLPAGPDSELYKGLSKNLMNGTGYIDTIRNDFILPSIGHPLVLYLFSLIGLEDLVLSKLFFYSSLLISFYAFKALNYSLVRCVLLTCAIPILLPTLIINGAESSLFFVVGLSFLTLFLHLKKRQVWSGVLVGLAVVLFLLIRPLLLPLLWLLVPVFSVATLFKTLWRTPVLSILITVVSGFYLVQFISNQTYTDSRLTTGTYSGITLYSAFNPYVNLETTYYSSLWAEIPEEEAEKGLAPLRLAAGEGWQTRDNRLKSLAIEYVKEQPANALSAYWWRFKKFSLSADNSLYIILFFSWLAASILVMRKNRTHPLKANSLVSLGISLLPLYIILIQSLFVYAGYRYCLVSGLMLLYSVGYLAKEVISAD